MGRNSSCNQTHLVGVGTQAYPSEMEFPQTRSRARCWARLPIHLNDFSLSSKPCLCSTPRQSAGVLGEDSGVYSGLCRQKPPQQVPSQMPPSLVLIEKVAGWEVSWGPDQELCPSGQQACPCWFVRSTSSTVCLLLQPHIW